MALKTKLGERIVQLKNEETGETVEAIEVYKQVADEDFLKVQLPELLALLGLTGSRQAEVISFVLKRTDYGKNLFYATYREIADETGISKATVASAMQAMVKAKLMAPMRPGVYQLSPALAYRGNLQRRAYLVRYYEENCDSHEFDQEYCEKARQSYKQTRKAAERQEQLERQAVMDGPQGAQEIV